MPTGKNKVPMAQLRDVLTQAGLEDVQTYIQSGNVVTRTGLSQARLEQLIHKVIQKNFGGEITVIARTPNQISRILSRNPFREEDSKRFYFTVFATPPDKQLLQELLETDFSPDQVHFESSVLYTLYATKLSDSKFHNNFYERKLKVRATTRNNNTMTRLLAMAEK